MEKKLLTVKETAERLRTSERVVREEIRDKHLGAHMVRGTYRIPDDEIDAYLERGATKPATPKKPKAKKTPDKKGELLEV